jgi:ribosomal protein S18 acetylase RimI-like enzyme
MGQGQRIRVQRATPEHAEGISRVCSEGWRDTYAGLHSADYIEQAIREFYNMERIIRETTETGDGWDGWFVALDGEDVVGAIGGGMTGPEEAEVFVLYVLPSRRGEGIGTRLLDHLSDIQRTKGVKKQWVSVTMGNMKGIPFYEARGFRLVGDREAHYNPDGEALRSLRYTRDL